MTISYAIWLNLHQSVSAYQQGKEAGAFVEKLYTMGSAKGEFSGIPLRDVVLSDLDAKVLPKHLERDMKVVVVHGEVASKLIHNHRILISGSVGRQVYRRKV